MIMSFVKKNTFEKSRLYFKHRLLLFLFPSRTIPLNFLSFESCFKFMIYHDMRKMKNFHINITHTHFTSQKHTKLTGRCFFHEKKSIVLTTHITTKKERKSFMKMCQAKTYADLADY